MLNHYWLRVTLMLLLTIALPVQASAAAIMSVGGPTGSQSSAVQTERLVAERLVVKRDCHGQIVRTEIRVPEQTDDDVSSSTCPHCSVGCTMAGLTFTAAIARDDTPSFDAFAPRPVSFLSFIGRVPEHPPKG